MKFQSIFLAIALAAKVNANTSEEPCLAKCEVVNGEKECTFIVRRDQFASELGYFKFEGADGDCGGTNPVLGVEKGATYFFVQEDASNYYHALGFAYGQDGALNPNDELEPGIVGPGSTSDCDTDLSCPAPMYRLNGEYLGEYSNNPVIAPVNASENFGLDEYEPEFFYPLLDWIGAGTYDVALLYPEDNDFSQDFFYFCHIHQFMTGRIKFVDSDGKPTSPDDKPPITYDYQVPSAYDESCGTFGLEDFQLPNKECPEKFVCDRPDGPVGKFAECIDTMNCAMIAGMTTNVNEDNAICLFNHQMIPHHENAVNMCKALLITGEADCADLEDEDDQACVINVICQEIINVQNAQIQTMRGVLDELNCDQTDDCVVRIAPKKKKSSKSGKSAKRFKSVTAAPASASSASASSSSSSSSSGSSSKSEKSEKRML